MSLKETLFLQIKPLAQVNYLKLKIGTDQKILKITGVTTETINLPNGPVEKLVLTTKSTDGKEFNISEVWVKDSRGKEKVVGLWLSLDPSGQLNSKSAVAKLLTYHKVQTPGELLNLTAIGYSDSRDFTVLATYDK